MRQKLIVLKDRKLISAVVTAIRWQDTVLSLRVKIEKSEEYDLEGDFEFYAVNGNDIARLKFNSYAEDEGTFVISTDVIFPGYNHTIPRGSHRIMVCVGEYILADCDVSPDIVGSLADLGRNFLFDGRSGAYCHSFFVDDESDDELRLIFHTITVKAMNYASGRVNYKPLNLPKLGLKGRARKNAARFGRFVLKRPLPIDNKDRKTKFYKEQVERNRNSKKGKPVLLFMSEQNKAITANQKAVYDRLVERGDDKKFKILFSFRASVAERQSDDSWRRFLRKLASADIIVLDDHAPVMDWLVLKPETKVIQLWHAGAGFKSSGYSRWGNKGCPSTFSCHRQYTYGIAGSRRIAHFFSEVWGINTESVLPTGMPRMDEYLDEKYRGAAETSLREKYPLIKGKKVILFAPTYRGKNRATAHYPYELIDFDALAEVCADEWVVLFKMHPWVAEPIPIPEKYSDIMIDVVKYPNINDLFYVTDLLVTDYSSNIFEYSLMKKPMLFFAFDEIQYSFSRGFHRPYRASAPGKVVSSFDELLSAVKNGDFEAEKVEEYVEEHFDNIDSHSSDRVIDWLIFDNMPEDLRKRIDDAEADVEYVKSLRFPSEVDEPMELDFSPEGGEDEQTEDEETVIPD